MFSRRHPFLFFILVFAAIVGVTTVLTSIMGLLDKEKREFRFGEKVGVIEIEGMMTDARGIIGQIKAFREQESIKAIVLRINSPGGPVGPAQEIYREVEKTVKEKKVVASLGSIAASGGYYVASAADRIMANPGTITGSIGVIMGYTNFQELLQKIGLRPVVIKSGKYKDLASPVRELSEKERELLQAFTDNIHTQFIEDVAKGRGESPDAIRKIADGRIFSGETAKQHGLVDRLGNLVDAIEWAGRLGGIKGEIRSVYPPEKKLPIVEYLMDMAAAKLKATMQEMTSVTPGYIYEPGK
ncbi:MAG TPA: signal peptide peptidase SppA [Desulfosalsimonadaceae bacterium]|nr:signal peptide peptidase SppA [Desulfosalsimonadaceae bacterium]